MRLHFLDIRACGKGLLRTGNHDATDLFVGVIGIQCLAQLCNQFRVQRVERLGTVQSDQPYLAALFNADVLISHLAGSRCLLLKRMC